MKLPFYCPFYAAFLGMLSACQNQDEPSQLTDVQPTVSITATIDRLSPTGRYAQESETSPAHFAEMDKIGVFMDEKPAVLWIFSNTSWSTEKPMFWPDIQQVHKFDAYYPCQSPAASSLETISMPSLIQQNGQWKEIHRYDFLVASTQTSYMENHGNVSFSGEKSFKHVSTLLKINIKANHSTEGITLNELTLEGDNFFSESSYSLQSNKVMIAPTSASQNTLTIHPQQLIHQQDASYYLVVNGQQDPKGKPAKFHLRLRYTAPNQTVHTAQQKDIPCQLTPGNSYKFDLQINGGNLLITGGEISNWTPGNGLGDEITVHSEEDPQLTI